ncbi:MAG: hypothetical protein M1399_09265 [Actinobacteria bacterium]|nr:hypothetical protein [Actinomycetota bacterium]MCL5447307.1 hypothetical protein [Actinomycetota bacterium]
MSSSPSSFGVPSVTSGKTVTYNGLKFTVPESWKIYPGESCAFPGDAVSVGNSGSGICPSGGNPKVNLVILSIKGKSLDNPIANYTVRKADIHGVTVTLETGSQVHGWFQLPGPNAHVPLPAIWAAFATFAGYNVQFGATSYSAKQKSGLAPVLAVLDSVRPAG